MPDELRNYVDVLFIFTQIKNSDDMWVLMAIQGHDFRDHQLLVYFVLTELCFGDGLDSTERLRLCVTSLEDSSEGSLSEQSLELVSFSDR